MLSEAEELFLDHIIERAEISFDDGHGYAQMYSPNDVLPIYRRLKEINNECSKVTLELQKANEELARINEVYGP